LFFLKFIGEKKKMQILYSKTSSNNKILSALIILSILATSILILVPTAKAQEEHGGNPVAPNWDYKSVPAGVTPRWTINSKPFLSFSPNPIGIGQELLVNMWFTYTSAENRFLAGFTVTITKPDGTQDVIGPLNSYVADSTAWFSYIPEQVGTYKLTFSFPGEYFPAGRYYNGQLMTNTTGTLYPDSEWYSPVSTEEQTLIVQADQVMSWYSPLPTDYWKRPIEPNNREWNVIAGNYPWASMANFPQSATSNNYYGPFVTAPNTPHIVWKQLAALAGIIGGETGVYATLSSPSTPSVIYMGRAYQTVTKVMQMLINGTYRQQPTSVAECYDLRTGQIFYDIPVADGGVTPAHIAYWSTVDTAVPGAEAQSTFTGELHTISGGRLYKINPLTGAINVNISLPTFANAELMYFNGYYLSYQNIGNTSVPNYRVINWTEQGSSTDFTTRLASNISVTVPPSYRVPPTIAAAQSILGAYDPVTGIGVIQSRFYFAGVYGGNLVAINYVTGQVLWNITTDPNEQTGTTPFNMATALSENGKYYCYFEQGYWKAFDLFTGKQLWSTQINDYPWGEFSLYTAAGYNGILYYIGYTGVWALDENTGAILWHYADPAPPFETPYSSNGTADYSVEAIKVIDGKLFVTNNEHTPSQPATRGWGLICLNATSGEFLWKIKGTRMSAGAASDGYLTTASSYDGYMYVLGKGQSATTVLAPQTAITQGQSVVISGAVLDQSPASKGAPCVSDASMATYMDYLHMQMPIDGEYHNITVTGVPVSIDAVDPNGNNVHIATVNSDVSGAFGYIWKPDLVGKYTVTATFMGDASYGSSWAETTVGVVQAPVVTPAPTATPIVMPPYELYTVGTGIAVIIAIAIVGLLLLRKRP
jgi:PQQ-like domain